SAVFVRGWRGDRAAKLGGHDLHAKADAEHGHAKLEHGSADARMRNRSCIRSPRENDAARCKCPHLGGADVPGPDFAIDVGRTHAPRQQLRAWAAAVEDE